jgi:hypothetical protein
MSERARGDHSVVRTKTLLLHSVSAIATIAASNSPALAQVIRTPAGGYTYNVGGGLLFSPAEMSLAGLEEDKMGSGFETDLSDFNPHWGGGGFFSIGKQIDDAWDVRFGATLNKMLDSTGRLNWSGGAGGSGSGSGVSVSGFVEGRTSFGFAAMDFEVGYTPVLTENQSVRLFAGIRGLYFAERSEFSSGFSFSAFGSGGSGSGSSFQANVIGTELMSSTFIGVGPRGGISAAHRFDSTRFGVSGTVAGALLFGRQTTTFTEDVTFSGGSGSGSSFSSSFTVITPKVVVDVEAKGGLDYYLNDNTVLTIGYRAEVLRNVSFESEPGQFKLVHGPFLSLFGALP